VPARRIWSDEGGASVVEHAILVCVVALVAVTLVASGLSPKAALRSVAVMAATVFGAADYASTATSGEPTASKP
jgi:Flp pilus assembly pilin Flp